MKTAISKIHKGTPEHEKLIQAINEENFAEVKAYLQQNNLTHVDFSGDKSGNLDIIKLGLALNGTVVSSLDLSRQDLGFEKVVALCIGLRQTSVTVLKLSSTLFGEGDGVEAIFKALGSSPIKTIDLSHNNIPQRKVAAICGCIPQTNLLEVDLGFVNNRLQECLRLNQERLTLIGYESGLDVEYACFCQYFDHSKLLQQSNDDVTVKVSKGNSTRMSL